MIGGLSGCLSRDENWYAIGFAIEDMTWPVTGGWNLGSNQYIFPLRILTSYANLCLIV